MFNLFKKRPLIVDCRKSADAMNLKQIIARVKRDAKHGNARTTIYHEDIYDLEETVNFFEKEGFKIKIDIDDNSPEFSRIELSWKEF